MASVPVLLPAHGNRQQKGMHEPLVNLDFKCKTASASDQGTRALASFSSSQVETENAGVKAGPEQVTRALVPTPAPPGISSSSRNFKKKDLLHMDSPHRQTDNTARAGGPGEPHTSSLGPGQGHPRAPASTHWATCPLISSSLCLAFKLHRATAASLWGGGSSHSPESVGSSERRFCPQKT